VSSLIAGLGNPGKQYEGTRHNIGFEIVEAFASKKALTFREKAKFKGLLADGGGTVVLKPTTYMNLSGEAVRAVLQYFKISPSKTLVVVDDVDLSFGQIRLKVNSGPGTHNGLRSIENCLHTNRYARLKIGVGKQKSGPLTDHVLSRFTNKEEEELPQIIERAVEAIEIWSTAGITRAMEFANKKQPSNPSKEKDE